MLSGDRQWATRNKMQFAFGIGADGLEIGLYAPRSPRGNWTIVPLCQNQQSGVNVIRSWHSQLKFQYLMK